MKTVVNLYVDAEAKMRVQELRLNMSQIFNNMLLLAAEKTKDETPEQENKRLTAKIAQLIEELNKTKTLLEKAQNKPKGYKTIGYM